MTKLFSLVFLFSLSFSIYAQDTIKTKSDFSKKLHFGGGIQMSIGNGYTVIGVSPSVIYEISDQWASGVRATYIYSKDKLFNFSYNIYGGSALVQYKPIKEIQLHTEIENLYVTRNNGLTNSSYWVPAWYVGAGYAIGKHGAIGVRYDVLWDKDKSIYKDAFSPYIRFYF